MRIIRTTYWCIIIPLLFYCCSDRESTSQIKIKKLDYPSASAIEYDDDKLYIIGDDATNLLILDTEFNVLDSASIVLYAGNRIPKDVKPDLEASAIYTANNEPVLLFFGSGSLDPYRNTGWKYHLQSRTKENIYLQPLYSKIKDAGIDEINIEGACLVAGKLLLANRGNKGYPHNQLIIVDETFFKNDTNYSVKVIPFRDQKDTASFKGISGLTYAKQTDQLIITVSTEDTRNSYDDGAIGKSYLWLVNNFSSTLNNQSLNVDRVVDLEEIEGRMKGQKVESATVINEEKRQIWLALVADNDDGSSTIFKMSIKKE